MLSFLRSSLLTLLMLPVAGFAQAPNPPSSVQLYNDLQKLNFLGSALYIAAHPDDENTRLIAYLSNAVHARTAYLSMTRGDGGQNLIGTELRELLGVLRTQELLAARRIDGGEQFFTRAVDFGYSKHPDETLAFWNRDSVLSDVVRIIRQFRPDVIVNRFDHRTPGTTHGHHTSSAILSTEAFDLAANPSVYPDQLKKLEPWQPRRLFHNTTWWFYGSPERFYQEADTSNMVAVDIGVYYPERGLSNNEIASLASSQHLCQGFGRPLVRGTEDEFLELIKGDLPDNRDLFEGIDTSWGRIPGGSAIGAILEQVEANFNFRDPSVHLPELLKAYQLLSELEDSHWKRVKEPALKALIAGVSGLYLEASSEEPITVAGAAAAVNLEVLNRSGRILRLQGISLESGTAMDSAFSLQPNERHTLKLRLDIPEIPPGTDPYWLREEGSLGSYRIPSADLIGKPETPPAFIATFMVAFGDQVLEFKRPVIHRYSEPDKGERYRRLDIVPPVTAAFDETVKLFPGSHGQQVQLRVRALEGAVAGSLSLDVPEGWLLNPASQPFELSGKDDEQLFQFTLMPPDHTSEGYVSARMQVGSKTYDRKLTTIAYDHIPTQLVQEPARIRVVRLEVEKAGQHIGYVMGAGDAIPENLEAIGYTVHMLEPSELTEENLKAMDAVMLGIRAYNVLDELPVKSPALLNYVRQGGTLVVQYNTSGRGAFDFSAMAPYPFKVSRDRVSDETAAVGLVAPGHSLLNFPNPITEEDFSGWVQERGLYFASEWDDAYTPVLSMNDPGESELEGSLLVAPYGEGHYIYTGLSLFRELPAGVPGAFKILANMLSIGKAQVKNEREVKG